MIVCIVCIVCITLNAKDIKFCMNVQINCIECITETEYIYENVDNGNFVKNIYDKKHKFTNVADELRGIDM